MRGCRNDFSFAHRLFARCGCCSETGIHGFSFDSFVPPCIQTARLGGMRWMPPLVLHGAYSRCSNRGRFSQIVSRLLTANGIGIAVLYHVPDQMDLLRRFGFQVFYGDSTRLDCFRHRSLRRPKPASLRWTMSTANSRSLHALYPHYRDRQQMASMAKQGRDELEAMFARDAAAFDSDQKPHQD